MNVRSRARISESAFVTKFSELGLIEPLQRALAAKGYDIPTPIQSQAIPPLLEGRDLCGIAQTGTGKTAAFALPSIHHLSETLKHTPPQGCRMLVLAPTRELASQIAESFVQYGKFLRLSVATVFGGVPINKQIRQLQRGVDILVATPGRLLDLIDQRALSLKFVEIFVLDEADQMLDLGFIHALKRIDQLLPKKRQSLFFSATMPKAIAELGNRFLTDPVRVSVAPQSTTAERVEQFATFCNPTEKQALLTLRIRSEPIDRALVFSRTKHGADRIVKNLRAAGIESEAIHGNKSQPQRERALGLFRTGDVKILVATDIAARGIDVGGVSHVFNYELPNVAEQYVHRIGRTARAGAAGVAIAFVADDERPYLKAIEKLTKIQLEIQPLPENFIAEKAKLPKPAPSAPQPQGDRNRRHDGGGRNAEGQPKRRFARPKGAPGAHKGAVRRFGGGGGR
ncbi:MULTISPECIES: DEAD/DEAH box helicase [unclassified Sphingomonas]|uniref:DEAD/DEAH box helicase n=1 Tax=unclassified Sphingomonas TaxID=196159 RepID=UPI0006FD5434|nr:MULTISPECIES: DEAD/DEAH box helicase [unclassified Sphingomonas]KQX19383.1 DEAD/DEAH box helicase [Sphingomonas sp. Root1294]KQY65586.1 DEAD/DEAH box helicase [Sphingomonas sp. Root50]KRB95113.1 DEAD/DEAH box helicase [Sphingomonas sp. Root720]